MAFYISRFKDIEKHEFEAEVVTPLFLGGADTKKAELRVASIKGALRFWWRALYGRDDLEDMKKVEADIFGSTENKSNLKITLNGTEKVKGVISDLPQGLKIPTQSKGRTFPISIIEYLAFGLYEYKKELRKNVYTKEHIAAGTKFSVAFKYNKAFEENILNAFKALATYGGIGSHSRNGFGSLTVDVNSYPIIAKGDLKNFSAISSQSRLFNGFSEKGTWEDALSEIGRAYREARTGLESKHVFQKRSLIAKPLIVKGEININDRHAKPYFLHVNKQPNGKYRGQIFFMPYNYEQSKRKDYFDACEKMNEKLLELSGGVK